MAIQVIYPTESLIPEFWKILDIVAKEKTYLETVEAPPLEKVLLFQRKIIADNGPVYYALENGAVVGWIDIFPIDNPRLAHRGGLGMGWAETDAVISSCWCRTLPNKTNSIFS